MSFRKSVLALAAIAAASLNSVPVPKALADVDVDVFVAAPLGFWPGWAPGRWISCEQGAQLVDHRGFNRVRPVDCNRPVFRYEGRRNREWFIIRVDGRRGRIISARPI